MYFYLCIHSSTRYLSYRYTSHTRNTMYKSYSLCVTYSVTYTHTHTKKTL